MFATLFTSCSNDNDNLISDNKEKLYTVNFKIKNTQFKIEESDLKSISSEEVLLNVFFYAEDGYISGHKELIVNLNDAYFDLSAELLAGDYKVAFVVSTLYHGLSLTNYYSYPIDYFELSRHVASFPNIIYDNRDVFYNNKEINVSGNQASQDEVVELNPMWSYLKINILDANIFDVPEGTEMLGFDIKPRYAGFGIANKLATKPYVIDESKDLVSLDSIRMNSNFTYTAALSETEGDNSISVNIQYMKKDADSIIVIGTRELKISQTTLKNGYNYNIKGKLGSKNSGQSMNISLGEFNPKDEVIEF